MDSEKWEYFYDDHGEVAAMKLKQKLWFHQSVKEIYVSQFGVEPNEALLQQVESLIDRYFPPIEVWYYLYAIPHHEHAFLFNAYFPLVTNNIRIIPADVMRTFLITTTGMIGSARKQAVKLLLDGTPIYKIMEASKVEAFDPSVLDFLEGKITKKTIDWGVGQVMKAHPKKYNPKEIKQAIIDRFIGE